jgi:hypothetical protein
MMKTRLLIFGVGFLTFCATAKTKKEEDDWVREKWDIINAAKIEKNESSLEALGLLVRAAGINNAKGELSPKEQEVFQAAREAFIETPNHLDYLLGKIEETTNQDLNGDYSNGRMRSVYFEILQQLQTPEAVSALGRLLFDENDPWKDMHWDDGGRPLPNSYVALMCLGQMGINNPPTHGPEPRYTTDLRPWQLWFEQVRAGTRTFSFVGSDTVYTLNGPVAEESTPAPITTRQPASPSAARPVQPSFPKLPLAIALVVLLTAIFAIVMRSQTRSNGP